LQEGSQLVATATDELKKGAPVLVKNAPVQVKNL
jgi:hypothetical protein